MVPHNTWSVLLSISERTCVLYVNRVLAVFWTFSIFCSYVLWILPYSTRSISGFNAVEYFCCTSSTSAYCTAGTAKYWQHLVRWYYEYSEYQNAQHAQCMYSEHKVCPWYVHTSAICAPFSMSSSPLYCRNHSRMVPRV